MLSEELWFKVVHTSMGTKATMDMLVSHPTDAMSRTRIGTLGAAYLRILHVSHEPLHQFLHHQADNEKQNIAPPTAMFL